MRINRRQWARIALLGAAMALIPSASLADDPAVAKALKLAPHLDSANPKYRTIEIAGYVWASETGCLAFHARYQAPDQYMLVVFDLHDETPIFLASGGKAFFYDPLELSVLFFTSASVDVWIAHLFDKLRIEFNVSGPNNKPSQINFDAASLISASVLSREASESDDNTILLTSTTVRRNFSQATFERTRSCPLTKLELFARGQVEPYLSIPRIVANEPFPDGAFDFPSREALSKVIRVREIASDSAACERVSAAVLLKRALAVREAIFDPKHREKFSEVDWDRVSKNDAEFSKSIRTILPADLYIVGPPPTPRENDASDGSIFD